MRKLLFLACALIAVVSHSLAAASVDGCRASVDPSRCEPGGARVERRGGCDRYTADCERRTGGVATNRTDRAEAFQKMIDKGVRSCIADQTASCKQAVSIARASGTKYVKQSLECAALASRTGPAAPTAFLVCAAARPCNAMKLVSAAARASEACRSNHSRSNASSPHSGGAAFARN